MAINNDDIKLSQQEKQAIKENDPTNIPIDATNQGWTGDQIRAQMAESITADEGSVLSELDNKTTLIADKFDEVDETKASKAENALKVDKSGDTMTGTLTFSNSDETRLVLGNNVMTTDATINVTSFDNGDEVSDAIKFSDLTSLFDVGEILEDPLGGNNWLDAYSTALESKFAAIKSEAELNNIYLRIDGTVDMTDDLDLNNNDIVNLDGITSVKTEIDGKVDKTTTIAGLGLSNNITVGALKTAIGNATQSLDGLMSATDKIALDNLVALLATDDGDNVVDTISEILAIFNQYPEGADLVTALGGKEDSANIGNRTYTDNNVVVDEETVTSSIDKLDIEVATKEDSANIGDRTYTNDYVVTDNETVTQSIDALDTESQRLEAAKIDLDGDNSALNSLRWVHDATDPQNVVYSTTTYDSDRKTLSFATPDGTSLNIGGDLWFVNAKTNDALVDGDLVQFAGSQGDHYLVKKLVGSEIVTNPDYFVGLATHEANANDYVKVTWFGEVDGVDTNGYTVGDILYIDTVNSTLTNVEPTTQPIIQVAAITKEESAPLANDGRILVRPQFKSRSAAEVFVAEVASKITADNLQDTLEALYDKTQDHEDLTNNPHGVTAAQVGAYTTSEADTNFATASHTHTEADITGLDKYTQTQVNNLLTAKADLVAGKVPASQLPSYVDDVIEGYYNTSDGLFYTDAGFTAGNEITGETGKVYVDLVSGVEIYRWSGSTFTQIVEAVAFGTISGTAYEGNAGQGNADAIADLLDGTTTAKKAEQDADGNVITTTYATKTELSNATIDTLNDIGNVDTTGAITDSVLKYDPTANAGDGGWVIGVDDAGTTISTLDDVGDVNTSTVAANEFIKRNAANDAWENHALSKTDVGLNNVQNYGIATQGEAEAGTLDNEYMTPLKTKQALAANYSKGVVESNATTDTGFWVGTQTQYDALLSAGTIDNNTLYFIKG